MTARTPNRRGPFAAQSRDEPAPYSLPATMMVGVPATWYFMAAPRAVRVEVHRLHTVLHQIFTGRRILLDGTGRTDVIGGDGVAEDPQNASLGNIGDRRRLEPHAFEIGR